jgi:hypothetical protein
MKMKKIDILVLSIALTCLNSWALAQEPPKSQDLSKSIIAAKDSKAAFSLLAQAKEPYFKAGRFNEFCDFLKTLTAKNSGLENLSRYFYSLSRYEQLKYLEGRQSWDEYFDKGNDYRQDITSGLAELLKSTDGKDVLRLYARLLLWQFHQDQQDAFAEDALAGLMDAAKSYAENTQDPEPLKEAADKLQAYELKTKARGLYELYISKVVSAESKDEQLSGLAARFFQDSNLELAEVVYEAFIEKIIKSWPKEKAAAELASIARQFAYKDATANDPAFAEKVFQKLEGLSGKDIFDEQLSYLRAFSLEKAKEFEAAKAIYIDLLSRFSGSLYYDKINFKLGIISAYVSRNIKDAREYFQKLAGKESSSPEIISSLYQLGILAQWEEDMERARANYLKLKEKAGSLYQSLAAMAEARLKEIEEDNPLDSNIRNFLDVSLKDAYSSFNMSKAALKSSAYNLKKGQEFKMTAAATAPESGCMELSLMYGWVGELGKALPQAEESSFTSAYSEPGTKFIGLVVSTSGGVVDRAIDLIDVE